VLRRPRNLVLIALGALGLLVLVRLLAFDVPAGRRVDARVLEGFAGLDRPAIHAPLYALANLASPKPFVLLALVLVAIALVRRRPRTALAVGLAMVLANLSTQFLKPALATPRFARLPGGEQIGTASWPSGHATASMTLALAAVIVVPARWRPWAAAAGAAFTVAVSFSFLILHWHFASDVAGGYLVAAMWAVLGVAAILLVEGRRPTQASERVRIGVREALAPTAGIVGVAAAIAALVLISRPYAVVSYARAHTMFVVGAGIVGALALVLATGLALALRGRSDGPTP
jgi:membrane-associated phospholipid phosphatase